MPRSVLEAMAEPGSIAERVKQQADIVRVVGEYVRLKKSGQNFLGLCPFHQEKTPSFAVHPARQIYHCFGCGASGDVFGFVMELDKCSFPEAIRAVAEKCGISLAGWRGRGGAESQQATQQRRLLMEMHREATAFFVAQMGTPEGQAARGYLEDRGLNRETIARFAIGWAPSAGEMLVRHLRSKFPPALLDLSGLAARDPGEQLFDRFRRRVMFPIATEAGRTVAFGGRALGDEQPKYLNSPETRIYTKSRVLYNLDRAREAIRREGYAVLVEGYMDAIALAEAGIENVVASCGTSLAESQVRLLARFTRNVVVNYDVDPAGQAATDRSLVLLLGGEFEVRVLVLPSASDDKSDPDQFVRQAGPAAYRELLAKAPLYLDYLIARARKMDAGSIEGKLRAVNFLLPYVRLLASPLARSEWASRIASELRVEQAVLRQSLQQAAVERRAEVKPRSELLAAAVTMAERRLLKMLLETDAFRARLAAEIVQAGLHRGLDTEPLFTVLLEAGTGARPAAEITALGERLQERDRRLLFDLAFEPSIESTWEEAESCLAALKRRRLEADLRGVQAEIEALKSGGGQATSGKTELMRLLERKQALRASLTRLEA
ncbi:MAG TPA: DNA primase [Candidatus Acidoferrales bacterium]|nr:DNA primase [Candidatus Acidoferrales bacterium]